MRSQLFCVDTVHRCVAVYSLGHCPTLVTWIIHEDPAPLLSLYCEVKLSKTFVLSYVLCITKHEVSFALRDFKQKDPVCNYNICLSTWVIRVYLIQRWSDEHGVLDYWLTFHSTHERAWYSWKPFIWDLQGRPSAVFYFTPLAWMGERVTMILSQF